MKHGTIPTTHQMSATKGRMTSKIQRDELRAEVERLRIEVEAERWAKQTIATDYERLRERLEAAERLTEVMRADLKAQQDALIGAQAVGNRVGRDNERLRADLEKHHTDNSEVLPGVALCHVCGLTWMLEPLDKDKQGYD